MLNIETEIAKYFFEKGHDPKNIDKVTVCNNIYSYDGEIICSVDNDGIVYREWVK